MPSQAQLLTAFRQHMIDEGFVRRPPVAGADYPCFIQPDDGAPAPGEKEGDENNDVMILTMMAGGDIPSQPFVGFIRDATVDLYFRVAPGKAPLALDLEAQINAAIVDKWAWTMGGLYVLESSLFAGMQEVRGMPGNGSTWVAKYRFQIYRD